MHVKLSILAERDLEEGFSFYENQQRGLGDYFLDSLYADIDSLVVYAGIHRVVLGSHRLLAKTFPYAIYYDVVGDEARVLAVADCRRDPKWVSSQVKRRSLTRR